MRPIAPATSGSRRAAARALLAAGLLFAAPPAPGQAPASTPVAAPQVIAVEPIWDAGAVARGAKVSHEFVLKNQGVEMLRVREVRPSCGCTVASYDASIAPGAEGKVRVEVDTTGFSGAIAKEVTVFTSDPANAAIQLTMRALVQAPLDAQPGYFRFLHTQGAPAETATQVVWSADHPDLEVRSVESPLPSLTVSFRPAKEEERHPQGRGKQWVVTATLASEPPSGPLSGDVTIETNHPRQRTLAVPIAGYVRPVLMVTPPTADFGTFPGGESRRASVLITNYGTAPLELLTVDSDLRGLSARIEEREKGKRYDIALTLAAGVVKGPFAGSLRVRTSSAKMPLLEVPVKGEVR
jgi:Protein of unknown function (DUF1573)